MKKVSRQRWLKTAGCRTTGSSGDKKRSQAREQMVGTRGPSNSRPARNFDPPSSQFLRLTGSGTSSHPVFQGIRALEAPCRLDVQQPALLHKVFKVGRGVRRGSCRWTRCGWWAAGWRCRCRRWRLLVPLVALVLVNGPVRCEREADEPPTKKRAARWWQWWWGKEGKGLSLVDTWTVVCPNSDEISGIAPRRHYLVSRSVSDDRRDVKKGGWKTKNRSEKISLTFLFCSHTPEMLAKNVRPLITVQHVIAK